MPKVILTDARVKALRPRKIAYDIRDGRLAGFGLRVLPSGRKRFFVHSQHRGDRVWKILGDAATMSVDEAQSSAVRTLAAIRRGEDPPRDPAETLFVNRLSILTPNRRAKLTPLSGPPGQPGRRHGRRPVRSGS